jgi:GT2 family glycosyltransferase/glycosyltransferase involved in cell wall biosynthesis
VDNSTGPTVPTVAVVLATHNRQSSTLRCLASLLVAAEAANAQISVIHVDDGSTDGTAQAVLRLIPDAQQVLTDGNQYWAGAMRQGLALAYQSNPDYVLWLNDDVLLYPDALSELLAVSNNPAALTIAVGALVEPGTDTCSYSAVTAQRTWRNTVFGLVTPDQANGTTTADTMNGNFVLLPRAVYQHVGNFDPVFQHGMADYDYGLRATHRFGCRIAVSNRYVGECARNTTEGTFRDRSLGLRKRWKLLLDPKGLPPKQWLHFQRCHGGPTWPIAAASPYLKTLIPGQLNQSVSAPRATRGPATSAPASSPPPTEVVILYKSLPHYRVPLYELMREQLAQSNVTLRLIVGQPNAIESTKNDTGEITWAELVQNRQLPARGQALLWQPVLRSVRHADLVVVEQASKLIVNNLFAVWRRFGGPQLALWGHGINRNTASRSAAGEWWKKLMLHQSDWFFAYTSGVARDVIKMGASSAQVTDLHNAIDTRQLSSFRDAVTEEQIDQTCKRLGVGNGQVGLYVGSLYREKALLSLVKIAEQIRVIIPDFELLIVGDGEEREELDLLAESRPWLHILGTLFAAQLAQVASVASLMMIPGAVGLVVLDAGALRLPIITSDRPDHGPEIDYVTDGVNGLVCPVDETAAAAMISELLRDPERLARMTAASRQLAEETTIENMASRFTQGILDCLAQESSS